MPKRRRESESEEYFIPSKRSRAYYAADQLSFLSDEIVLRILSYLSVPSLATCQRVSRRFHDLSSDSEIWKEKYYGRFVRPRALRIPGINTSSNALLYSSKLSKWLDEDHLVRKGRETDWKAQYRLRHNWSNGKCQVNELEVAQIPVPQALVKYYRGLVVTLNQEHDLRVWRMKDAAFLGEVRAVEQHSTPTSLAIDTREPDPNRMTLAVGYDDGSFKIFDMEIKSGRFIKRYAHPPSSNGSISSIASTFPYLLTLSRNKTLSLYHFPDLKEKTSSSTSTLSDPTLLSSLLASQAYSPVTLSLRLSPLGVIASIAYSYSRLRLGWNIGLQELLIKLSGEKSPENSEIISSRLAWTPDWTERTASILYDTNPNYTSPLDPASQESFPLILNLPPTATIRTKPTSLSYSHPYLLASYPDNTLKVYQVSSTADALTIGSGRRLWGHTSGVSGAEVSERGKAVSVSAKGNDVRIWELEESLGRSTSGFTNTVRSSAATITSEVRSYNSGGLNPTDGSSTTTTVTSASTVNSWQPRGSVRVQPTTHLSPIYSSTTSSSSSSSTSSSSSSPAHWANLIPSTPPPSSSKPPTISQNDSFNDDEDATSITAGGWIAFDSHRVVVLNDRGGYGGGSAGDTGRKKAGQFVTCYDFT